MGHCKVDGVITPEYTAWTEMKQRCNNPNHRAYPRYGGRGIAVCQRWQESFEAFYEDMGPRPTVDDTLERLDNEKGYCPENCAWTNRTHQQNNRRTNRFITAHGKTMTISQWSREIGVGKQTLLARLNRGWPDEDVITIPLISGGAHYTKRRSQYKRKA